jgi:hypothetical protein
MTEYVTIQLPLEVVENLREYSGDLWSEDESDELYEAAVTCGNADDSFSSGSQQGAAYVADVVLSYLPN